MKPWMKYGSAAAILTLLAACSSGIQTPEEPTLTPQADGSAYERIRVSSDDAEQTQSGMVVLDSPDLDLGLSKTDVPTTVGLRFNNLSDS